MYRMWTKRSTTNTIQATTFTAIETPESVVARENATTIGRIAESDEEQPGPLLELRELLEIALGSGTVRELLRPRRVVGLSLRPLIMGRAARARRGMPESAAAAVAGG